MYCDARYYDPGSARFLSRDTYDGTIGNPITRNHYLYANASPAMYIDPSGNMGILGATFRVIGKGILSGIKRVSFRISTQAGKWLGNNLLRLGGNITKFTRTEQAWIWYTRTRTLRKIPQGMRGSGKVTNSVGMDFRQLIGRKGADTIRIMKGRPNARYASQRVDYVKINKGTPIGRNGVRQSSGNTADAHIPLSEWLTWTRWYAP